MQAMIVPRSDAHQNEYVAPSDERLKFISGFTGSAGVAVITTDKAALFTDGRYTLQAQDQLPDGAWELCHVPTVDMADWLIAALPEGANIGFDARLHRMSDMRTLAEKLEAPGLGLVPLTSNPIDGIWQDQPSPPMGKMVQFPEEFAGESVPEKLARVSAALRETGSDGLVISSPESLAWLTNTRGSDIDMLPVTFGHGIVSAQGALDVFLEPAKLDPDVLVALSEHDVTFGAPEDLSFAQYAGKLLRFDKATASVHLVSLAEAQGAKAELGPDPISLFKAKKNATEISGTRDAHKRDAVAVTKFLRWFAQDRPSGTNEWQAAQALAGFREELNLYRSPSFSTISASAGNAAHAHYQASAESARVIGENELYLNDSGGQYLDGTTDITRVTYTGTPSAEMKMRYTQVLRGHMALLRQRFPKGVDGGQLDSIARMHLWQEGIDFDHGTGHGVGHYLSVHEGPQSISKRGGGVPLLPGMIVSIEPGYYKADAFGIRIENLAVVREVETPPALADRVLYEFENLTFVPYERGLIDTALLSVDEIGWIDDYHRQVRDVLEPQVSGADLDFVRQATAPL